MRWWKVTFGRLRVLFRKEQLEEDLDDELRFHLEMQIRDNIERGMAPDEARRVARLRFGNGTLIKEDSRQVWGFRWLEELGQDLRFAVRSFRRSPGSTTAAVATLALGLGVGTAVFSVVNALLFKPLQYKDPDRLVMVWSVNQQEGVDVHVAKMQGGSMSTPEIEDWNKSGIFESMVAFGSSNTTSTYPGEPQTILAFGVSPGFFETTGVQPFLGRGFLPEEEPKGGRNNVLVITYKYWRQRFHEDPNVIGKELVIQGGKGPEPAEIIAVMPPGFSFFSRSKDAIRPLHWEAKNRGSRWLRVMARLKDGLSLEQAQARADVFSDGLADRFTDSNQGWKVKLVPVEEDAAGSVRAAMLALLAAVGCVLFIACSNVASLFLVQFTSRSQEISMRCALGASRMRVLRQLLTESMTLSISGGVLGFGLAILIVRYFRSVMPSPYTFLNGLVQLDGIEVDSTLVLFASLISLLAGILVALIPVFRSSRLQLESSLREAGRTAFGNRSGSRSHDALVMAEVAVAVVLVVASGLLVRSVSKIYQQGPGFEYEKVAFFEVRRIDWKIRQELQEKTESRQEYFVAWSEWRMPRNEEIRSRVAAIPGVSSVTLAAEPLKESYTLHPVTAPHRPGGVMEPVAVQSVWDYVGVGYFEILRVPVWRGRSFESRDTKSGVNNVVINQELAGRLWGDADPIGRRLRVRADEFTVVGVVGNIQQEGVRKPPLPMVYTPRHDWGAFLIRTERDFEGLWPEVRQAVREADPTAYLYFTLPMADYFHDTNYRLRYSLILLGGLSALALILALVGLYSTLSYIVRRRTGEIGLRMALGADQREVLRLVLRHGLTVVGVGLLIGLTGSAAATRFLSSILFGVTPTDPLTFVVVACAIVATALVAAYLPARRASKVDPMVALRHE